MEKLIRSKFLSVAPEEENGLFLISHERENICIEAETDVIDFIDRFAALRIPDTEDPNQQELCRLLTRLHFLHDQAYGEREARDILTGWLGKFEKEIRQFSYQEITACYAARVQEPVGEILIEVLKIGQELHKELMAFGQPLYILFLTPEEYRSLQEEFHVPHDISAFVDSRTLLIMDYESYFRQNNTKSFYPTIRHELIHLLFGQYAYYLPFWVEEGICEYYSNKYRVDYLNYGLKEEPLISFAEIHSEKVNYIAQLSSFGRIQHVFYPQAVSFMDFLFRTVNRHAPASGITSTQEGERVWMLIRQSGIRRDFFDILETECGITLAVLQRGWESFIKQQL